MDTQPKMPTLKDSQKPQVKIRGLEAGVTLFDRLKQFKKKDLAFILAGLGTLFMAPLAEHFMMSPETGGDTMQAGWGGKGGGNDSGMFGGGSSPYEQGTTGLAPGSAIGGGSDIITPLNVRDPSALVMGPGGTQQPPTNSVMPATPPPTAPVTHSDTDLKDALAASARGVGAAAKAAKVLLPVPKIALNGGGGLRGLGVASGGSSAQASLAPISSGGLVSGKAATNTSLGAKASKDYKGVARGAAQGGGSGIEALKKAADDAGGAMNRGPAAAALNDAANTAIPAGGGAFGGDGAGGTGSTDKANTGDQNKDGKSVGESLAFLKAKAIQDAQIALWSKEQEAGDNKLEALKIRNAAAEALATKLAGGAGDWATGCLTKGIKKCMTPASSSGQYTCPGHASSVDGSTVNGDCSAGAAWSATSIAGGAYTLTACAQASGGSTPTGGGIGAGTVWTPCYLADADSTPSGTPSGPSGPSSSVTGNGANVAATQQSIAGMGGSCTQNTALTTNTGVSGGTNGPANVAYLNNYNAQMKSAVTARNQLVGGGADCGATTVAPANSVVGLLQAAIGDLTPGANAAIDKQMIPNVTALKSDGVAGQWTAQVQAAEQAYNQAKSLYGSVNIDGVNTYLGANTDQTTNVPSALRNQDGTSNFSGLRQSVSGIGPMVGTNGTLQNPISQMGTLLTELDKAAATDKGTLISTIKLTESLDSKVAKYNAQTPPPATPLTLDWTKQAQQPQQQQGAAGPTSDAVGQAITTTDKTVDPVRVKLTAATATVPPTPPVPGAQPPAAPTQADVDGAKASIQTVQQQQTANLNSQASNFQGVLQTVNGIAGNVTAPTTH